METEELYFKLNETETLFLKWYRCENNNNFPILMIHGAIENGKIFYSSSHKGLAPFLCKKGFNVFVADLRGHGNSSPKITKNSKYGQFEHMTEDIPAFIEKVLEISNKTKLNLIAHSWGGVLVNGFFARNPKKLEKINKSVYFGSKRKVKGINREKALKVYFMWGFFCRLLTFIYGYLPAVKFNIGSDNDTKTYLLECTNWVLSNAWVDKNDNFDYKKALKQINLKLIWYFAAKNDLALGHPDDVKNLMIESGEKNAKFTILSKENGNLHHYDHISMLTHPDAVNDHFPQIAKWLNS